MRLSKLKFVLLGALLMTVLAACGGSASQSSSTSTSNGVTTIKVGAVPVPHAEILQYINDHLAAKEGIKIKIVSFNDYVQPNTSLQDGSIDANYFQHVPYMEDFNKQHNMNMVAVTKVHIEPLGVYSHKVKSFSEVSNGAVVAIPNDVTNTGRALKLLADNGLITLKAGVGTSATVHDIANNPKNLQFKELESAQLPRSLDDTTLSVINGNYALQIGLTPSKDALALESAKNNPYANVLAVLKGHENDPAIKKLAQLLNSPEVKQFIINKYHGSVIPAF
ncbi:MetQ/NlpA family ABC transporter substrate-binding protein [Dictyobacter arantiisoli]|uniref:Lipoprotein n=1 Tax=Dictyobacter arantiisoli TaxID=2014874 RepID=A0A5A5TJ95_9CHLR|nr:MetQ/NlpA family ABC transporter substrate-binding protein [Dictyobacter arantiisoli]GCF11412.1 lipoprotein [Dictyobacter arantiisoli]